MTLTPEWLAPEWLAPEWLAWPQTRALVAAFAPDQLRFVGGAVRDAVLGRMVQDVDAATVLLPEAVMAALERAGIRAIPTGIAHGTVTALVGEKHFEITTLRKDVSTDGRHAEVAFTDSWREDARRRDFTMNAMYMGADGELFDYFDGQADAQAGIVRFIGDAGLRIEEDYLRILRFFRFFAHYGQGMPDEAAIAACVRFSPNMAALSGERVQAEMVKLLAARRATDTLMMMQSYGVLAEALSVQADVKLFARLDEVEALARISMPAEMRLAGLVWDAPHMLDALSARLRLSGKLDRMLRLLLRHTTAIAFDMDVPAQKRLLRQVGAEAFSLLVLFSWAAGPVAVNAAAPYPAMLALARDWELPVFPVTGDDLIARGVAPGKAMGDMLRQLEKAWEDAGYALGGPELLALIPGA